MDRKTFAKNFEKSYDLAKTKPERLKKIDSYFSQIHEFMHQIAIDLGTTKNPGIISYKSSVDKGTTDLDNRVFANVMFAEKQLSSMLEKLKDILSAYMIITERDRNIHNGEYKYETNYLDVMFQAKNIEKMIDSLKNDITNIEEEVKSCKIQSNPNNFTFNMVDFGDKYEKHFSKIIILKGIISELVQLEDVDADELIDSDLNIR